MSVCHSMVCFDCEKYLRLGKSICRNYYRQKEGLYEFFRFHVGHKIAIYTDHTFYTHNGKFDMDDIDHPEYKWEDVVFEEDKRCLTS